MREGVHFAESRQRTRHLVDPTRRRAPSSSCAGVPRLRALVPSVGPVEIVASTVTKVAGSVRQVEVRCGRSEWSASKMHLRVLPATTWSPL